VYDMYPEWGPAPHDPDQAARARAATLPSRATQPVQEALDRRDNGAPRVEATEPAPAGRS
jgi:hypothetical protein